MAATPDSDLVQHAYTKACALGRQGLTLGMIMDDLRRDGFSDEVITAAFRERYIKVAEVYKKVSARLFRVAIVMAALGVVAWPITAMFDFGILEQGVVICLFGASLFVAGRGVWSHIKARQSTLSDDQVAELVANGEITMPKGGGTPVNRESKFADPEDQLTEALLQTDAIKRIKTASFWSQVVVFLGGCYLGITYLDSGSWTGWVGLLIGLPLFYFVVLKLTPAIAVTVGKWVEFGSESFGSSGPSFTGENMLLTEVPRAPNLPIPSDDDVIRAERLGELAPMATSGGGRGLKKEETKSGEEQNREALPPGVVVFTADGIVFYPNVDSTGEVVRDTAHSLLAVASTVSPLAQAAAELGLSKGLQTEDPELPLWLRQAREKKDHFVIPWPELVTVHFDPFDQWVSLFREYEDGTRKFFLVRSSTDEWPEALMSLRMRYEVMATLRQFVELPRMREILPELVEKFRGIYGDRVEDHWPEIVQEAQARVSEQAMGDAVQVLVENLSDRLPYYGKYPKVRSTNPHFFSDDKTELAEDVAEDIQADTKTAPPAAAKAPKKTKPKSAPVAAKAPKTTKAKSAAAKRKKGTAK